MERRDAIRWVGIIAAVAGSFFGGQQVDRVMDPKIDDRTSEYFYRLEKKIDRQEEMIARMEEQFDRDRERLVRAIEKIKEHLSRISLDAIKIENAKKPMEGG